MREAVRTRRLVPRQGAPLSLPLAGRVASAAKAGRGRVGVAQDVPRTGESDVANDLIRWARPPPVRPPSLTLRPPATLPARGREWAFPSRRSPSARGGAPDVDWTGKTMATLLLSAAGGAVGGLFGPLGAILGRAAGGLAGYAIDQSLFSEGRTVKGSRLSDLDVQASREGAPIPRVYGRVRIAGEMIWATRFEEEVSENTEGGKGGELSGTTVKSFRYFANFAIALCGGTDRSDRPGVGRRQAVQPRQRQSPRPPRRREPGAGQPDRGEAGRGQGAGLSRHRLCRLRTAAARKIRQPGAAILLRGDPPGRPGREEGARRSPSSPAPPSSATIRGPSARSSARDRSARSTATSTAPAPTGTPRSTNCRRSARISKASAWW